MSHKVTVRTTGHGKYQQEIISGNHRQLADEPVKAGGSDTGPDPYSYLMAALGACTAMTMQMYADRKGWPLDGVEVYLSHDIVSAGQCSDCKTKTGKIDRINREIKINGPNLTAAQRQKLMEIADKCPVHKTLTGEVVINSQTYKPPPPPSLGKGSSSLPRPPGP